VKTGFIPSSSSSFDMIDFSNCAVKESPHGRSACVLLGEFWKLLKKPKTHRQF
jgi:hypothetical protein